MTKRHTFVSVWLSLALGLVFALCALFVVLFGADVYTSVLSDSSANDLNRTATLYIANKVRQSDVKSGVAVGEVEGDTALVLREMVDGEPVLTYLYLYDGNLCEVSAVEGTSITKGSGQPVMPLNTFALLMDKTGLIRVSLSDRSGHSAELVLALRTAEGKP